LLELVLILLLALITFAPESCYKGPWRASQSLSLKLRPVMLLALLLLALWLLFWCRGHYCAILNQSVELELMLLLALLTFTPATCY